MEPESGPWTEGTVVIISCALWTCRESGGLADQRLAESTGGSSRQCVGTSVGMFLCRAVLNSNTVSLGLLIRSDWTPSYQYLTPSHS